MKGKKDFIILLLGYMLQYITAIVTIRIFTTIISAAEVGRINILTTITLWFNIFLNGVFMYVQRKLFDWDLQGIARKYIFYVIYYIFLIAICGTLILVVIKNSIGIGISINNYWFIVLILGVVFFYNLNAGFIGWLNLFKKRIMFVLLSNLTLWISLVISVMFALLISKSAENWLLGQIIGQILILFFSSVLFFKLLKPSNNTILSHNTNTPEKLESISSVFNFAWPISISSLLIWLQTQPYRFILARTSGIEAVGLFGVGFGIGMNFINRFDILFSQFYHPIFFKEIANSDTIQKTNAWNKYASSLIPAIFILSLYIILGSPFIAKIFVGEQFYFITKNTIIWGVLSQLCLVFMTMYSMSGIAQQNTKDFIFPNFVGASVALSGVFVLSRWKPYLGTGIALFLGAFSTLFFMRAKMKKLLPIQFPAKRIIYSLVLSIPLIVFFIVISRILPEPTIFQSLVVLGISGLYLLLMQFVLARKWLSISWSLSVIDDLEQRLKLIWTKVYEP